MPESLVAQLTAALGTRPNVGLTSQAIGALSHPNDETHRTAIFAALVGIAPKDELVFCP